MVVKDSPNKIIAFIGCRLSYAQTDIRHDYEIISTKDQRQGSVKFDGAVWNFIIATQPKHLMGCYIDRFEFLPSSVQLTGSQRAEMRAIAIAHLRAIEGEGV